MNENVLTVIGKRFVLALFAGALLAACVGACTPRAIGASSAGALKGNPPRPAADEKAEVLRRLDDLAERERSTGFQPGMGLSESSLREKADDYSGAALAAFKELLYARSLGAIDEGTVRNRLAAVVTAFGDRTDEGAASATAASKAAEAFLSGRWKETRDALDILFPGDAEADGFPRWMKLVCRLEEKPDDREARNAYSAIRARYERFPEYWYRSARAGIGDAAERCVALAPRGPFAAEARRLMASSAGLSGADGASLLCRAEIEETAREAAASLDPKGLEKLYPTLSLPDNPYTLYALGIVKGLASGAAFKTALADAGNGKGGRLGERLRYAAGR